MKPCCRRMQKPSMNVTSPPCVRVQGLSSPLLRRLAHWVVRLCLLHRLRTPSVGRCSPPPAHKVQPAPPARSGTTPAPAAPSAGTRLSSAKRIPTEALTHREAWACHRRVLLQSVRGGLGPRTRAAQTRRSSRCGARRRRSIQVRCRCRLCRTLAAWRCEAKRLRRPRFLRGSRDGEALRRLDVECSTDS